MPLHDLRCLKCGGLDERRIAIADLDAVQVHSCGGAMERVFFRFPFATVTEDVSYESPIDGRVISSRSQRADDLARNNCIEYDPEMKTDYMRRQKESDIALERAIDRAVEETIDQMPTRKRELLDAELRGGATVEPQRLTGNPTAEAVNG